MKKSIVLSAAMLALLATSGMASAADAYPYVKASNGSTVMTNYNLGVRTGYWTPALAEGIECDADIANSSKIVLAADTLFDVNYDKLKPEGLNMLQELVARMAGLNVEVVMATGYTDRTGPDAYNQALSERRAEAVKTFMVAQGVPADKIQTEGKGPADPVVTCSDEGPRADVIACLAPNRRAVVEVVGTRAQ